MKDKTKNLGRNVRFNVAIADYRPGQVVRYGDMPDGHRFWADNKSILQTTRICEFTDEDPEVAAPPEKTVIIPEVEKPVETKADDMPDFDKAETDVGNEKTPDLTTDGKKSDPGTETKRGRGRPITKTHENK